MLNDIARSRASPLRLWVVQFCVLLKYLCLAIGRRTHFVVNFGLVKILHTTFRRTPFMAQVTLKGNPVQVNGQLPQAGSKAPAFSLVAGNLSDVTLKDFAGKRKVLNIFPSVDTPTCATSVRKFNAKASERRQHRRAVHLR